LIVGGHMLAATPMAQTYVQPNTFGQGYIISNPSQPGIFTNVPPAPFGDGWQVQTPMRPQWGTT
jgi:hypothetical protein